MLLQVEKLKKSFGTNQVLTGIDLEVRKGDSLVILGGSGAGKSVLVRHMAGLIKP
nr:ATP-binding cassette domain-containing protein [Acidobacteriota bacterium]